MKNKKLWGMFICALIIFGACYTRDAFGYTIQMGSTFGLPNPSNGIPGILTKVVEWILGIVGSVAIVGFAISGIVYMTAAGDDDRMGKAKDAMMYSIIGVIVALSSAVIIVAIDSMLRGNSNF